MAVHLQRYTKETSQWLDQGWVPNPNQFRSRVAVWIPSLVCLSLTLGVVFLVVVTVVSSAPWTLSLQPYYRFVLWHLSYQQVNFLIIWLFSSVLKGFSVTTLNSLVNVSAVNAASINMKRSNHFKRCISFPNTLSLLNSFLWRLQRKI